MLRRFYRLRDAPAYLGVDKNYFNREVRPFLTEIRHGAQCIKFDRLEMDAWADHHRDAIGRPPEKEALWQKGLQDSTNEEESGKSTKSFRGTEGFAKAAANVISTRRRRT